MLLFSIKKIIINFSLIKLLILKWGKIYYRRKYKGFKFNNNIEIVSKNSEYDRLENKIIAEKNVVVLDKENNNKLSLIKLLILKMRKIYYRRCTRALIDKNMILNPRM